MNISIYDKNLDRISIIENRFVSCFWSEGYNTAEPFTLELQETEEYKKKIRPGCLVGRSDRRAIMVISTVECRNGTIVATGRQAAGLFADVVFIGEVEPGKTVDKAILEAYNKTSKCANIEFAESSLTATYDEAITNMSMLNMIELVTQSKDVGFRVVKNGKKLVAEFYQPTDDNPYRLAKWFGNVDVHSVVLSTSNLKNYAFVIGADRSGSQVIVEVDETNGDDRKEMVIESGESQQYGESAAKFEERLRAVGHESLNERKRTWSADFSPIGSGFGEKYDIGDFVHLTLPDFGLTFVARVMRFREIEQHNTNSITVSIGDITIVRRKK